MRLAFTPSSPDYLIIVPDYHPSYGLDDTTRAEVLRLIRVDGLPVREVAARFNIGLSTIYKWLAHTKKGL